MKEGTDEAKDFIMEDVLLGVENLGPEEEMEMYKICRKGEREYFKGVRQDKQNQIEEDLQRKYKKVSAERFFCNPARR